MKKRLIFIDMDGTIIHGDYSGAFLCRLNGVTPQILRETELPEARGEIDWMAGDRTRAAMMRGLDVGHIEANLHTLSLIQGLAPFIQAVKEMDFIVVLASAGPACVAGRLAGRWGFDHWFASDYGEQGGRMTGAINAFISAEEKERRALDLCRRYGADPQDCAAIGDGDSDVAMLARMGCSVALNAGAPAALRAAQHRLKTGDIRDVLPILQAFVDNK